MTGSDMAVCLVLFERAAGKVSWVQHKRAAHGLCSGCCEGLRLARVTLTSCVREYLQVIQDQNNQTDRRKREKELNAGSVHLVSQPS